MYLPEKPKAPVTAIRTLAFRQTEKITHWSAIGTLPMDGCSLRTACACGLARMARRCRSDEAMQRPTMKLVRCATMRSRDCHFRIASRSMKKAITRRRLMELTAAFAASSAVAHSVQAQAYPNRTIRLIAPFPAGGGTDSAARIIAARLSELLGQQGNGRQPAWRRQQHRR